MTSKVEQIIHNGKVFALILKTDSFIENVEFFTPKDYPFQMGAQIREMGEEIKPHIHKPIQRVINNTQEMIHIDYGKVKAKIYNEKGKEIKDIILNSGDTILLVKGGHSFKFLEKTKIIEVKQGPYIGREEDKYILK